MGEAAGLARHQGAREVRAVMGQTSRARGRVRAAAGLVALVALVLALWPSGLISAKEAADLDQCRNGGIASPQTVVQCVQSPGGNPNAGWVNGNAGASNAHYAESESIS